MIAVFATLDAILGFYTYIVIGSVIFSWLYAFNVINSSNQFVAMIGDFLNKLTEPILGRIRRVLPNMGGLDLSPIALLFGIYFIRIFLATTVRPMFL